MAGLYIRELLMRADAKRILIVAPGSLVEQWQDEMFEKFGLSFTLFSREQVEQSRSGNPFDDHDLMVARIDQLSRNEELQEKLRLSHWDLIVVDEAHKLSANYFGNKVNKTKRFQLGELLGSITRHFLLMTATPHNGKEEDFQLFMSLLDSDRFFGKFRDGAHKVDVTDLMRRTVKEEMLRFDGTKLFPDRRAITANYKLSDLEAALYSAVTDYVKEEMNRADQLDGQRKGTVGFALTSLQRRLASSPEAIYQSLKRRRIKLKRRVEDEKLRSRGQPYFIRSFFNQAFIKIGGELRPREQGRYEITHVPANIRERDRQITGRDRRNADPVLRRYERVCFEKQYVRLIDRVGTPMASLIHPGHPLMQSVTDLVLEQHRNKLKQGAVLVDPSDMGLTPKVMFIIDHSVKEGAKPDQVVSRRIQFVEIDPQGVAINAGWAPHLDMEPISQADLALIQDVFAAPWLNGTDAQNLEHVALAHASTHMVPEHFDEVRSRREQNVDKTLNAVHERLVKEINYWSDRYIKLQDDIAAGKDVRLTLDNVRRTIDELTARREFREKELLAMRHVISATPVIAGGALVIPAGLLAQRKGEPNFSADADARARVEWVAMHAVMNAERALGHEVIDVSAQKCGWDVTSMPRAVNGRLPPSRHIEVKGRAKGNTTVTAAGYAEAQRAAEEATRPATTDSGTPTTGSVTQPPRAAENGTLPYTATGGTPKASVKKQFYGSIELDAIQAKKQFSDLVDEVILQFTSRPGVKVKIAIEIQADSTTGFDDGLQRAVKENCNVLKFKNAEFEGDE
jgi:hypothetical protein